MRKEPKGSETLKETLVVRFGVDVDRNRTVEFDEVDMTAVELDERAGAGVAGQSQELAIVGAAENDRAARVSLP